MLGFSHCRLGNAVADRERRVAATDCPTLPPGRNFLCPEGPAATLMVKTVHLDPCLLPGCPGA